MANIIGLERVPNELLKMSNGATDVLVDLLKLYQARLLNIQKNHLVEWIISHHNLRMGDGFSGFDIGEMPWDKNCFTVQREAFISVLEDLSRILADASTGTKLGYEPSQAIMGRCIAEF